VRPPGTGFKLGHGFLCFAHHNALQNKVESGSQVFHNYDTRTIEVYDSNMELQQRLPFCNQPDAVNKTQLPADYDGWLAYTGTTRFRFPLTATSSLCAILICPAFSRQHH